MNALIVLRLVVPVLLFVSWPFSDLELGAGKGDYQVKLDERYGIARRESTEINITDRGRLMIPKLGRSGQESAGPLYEVYWNSRCVFAKYHGFVHIAGMIDRISSHTFVVKRGSRRMQGPLSEKKLKSVARGCGVRGQIPWMSVRQAYIWSLETYPDQRWNPDFLKANLVATFWHGLLLLVMLLPVFLGLTLLFYLIDRYALDRFGRKRWNVWPYFVPGWPVAAISVATFTFLNETFLLLY